MGSSRGKVGRFFDRLELGLGALMTPGSHRRPGPNQLWPVVYNQHAGPFIRPKRKPVLPTKTSPKPGERQPTPREAIKQENEKAAAQSHSDRENEYRLTGSHYENGKRYLSRREENEAAQRKREKLRNSYITNRKKISEGNAEMVRSFHAEMDARRAANGES